MNNSPVFVHNSPLGKRLVTIRTDRGQPTHALMISLLRVSLATLPANIEMTKCSNMEMTKYGDDLIWK